MSRWKETELGHIPHNWDLKLVDTLINDKTIDKPMDGNHGNIHPKGSDFVESGIPFIMATDVLNGKVDTINCKFITKEQADRLQKGFSKRGDVLLTHKATLGRTAIVEDIDTPYLMLTPQVTYYRILDDKTLSNRFLKYYFDSPTFQGILESHGSSGSTRAYIGITAQRQLPILLPPPTEQKNIAEVLSSLDDKIDLLHRQNKTLESMTETLFRQRFVEEAKEDWEEATLYDSIVLVGGGTPKTKNAEYWNGNIKWLSGGDISTNHKSVISTSEKTITEEGLSNSSTKLLPKFSTVISARGTVGKYCILSEPMTFSQSNYGIKPKFDDCYFFTYLLINHSVKELQSAAYGSVFDTITTETFKGYSIKLPDENEINLFEKKIKDYYFKIVNNQRQIVTLENLRDTLLPKLMNGTVTVK